MEKSVSIKGAREHNLKNISIDIPRDKFVVITGLSGSGKSSLAFDTVYAEGQRRYLESLSAYARQFLEQMHKPDVDSIDGLSPSISIEQKNISRNPRSTVGTVTEIYDYLRLLYARIGTPHCSNCGKLIQKQTVEHIVDRIMQMESGTKFSVLAPIARGKKGEYQKELAELRGQGFVRALIDGEEKSLSGPIKLQKSFKHDISVYVDRLVIKPGLESRLTDAVEIATKLADGLVEVLTAATDAKPQIFSTRFACPDCGTSFPELEPRSFSFNSPHGACSGCDGIGLVPSFDPMKIVPDANLSLRDGAIAPWEGKTKAWQEKVYGPISKKYRFSLDTPWKDLPERVQLLLLFGTGTEKVSFKDFDQEYRGVIPMLDEHIKETTSAFTEWELEQYITRQKCSVCDGTRLKKEMLSVFVEKLNIAELSSFSIDKAASFVKTIKLTKQQNMIAEPILKEINARLEFLRNVGLSYLSLSRSSATLSGGEAQRIRLATQIGSSLVGVLYILDEPSIGLHQRDNEKLIQTLENLRDIGNSVLVVEHDEETIERADHVIDIGPGAGLHGGSIVFQGTPEQIKKAPDSVTGGYLSGRLAIEIPDERRIADPSKILKIKGASLHNLKNVDIDVPLGTFVCVTGVSGSGKSSLIIDTLLPALEYRLNRGVTKFPNVAALEGLEQLDKVTYVDQSPIGRTPRSNPATYTGLFTDIRTLFAELPESKVRGYTPGRFSFNVQGGRCEACTGDGTIKISMHFLPDVYVDCEVCKGKRYNRETLEVLYRGKSIADVLAMPVEQAAVFFERVPQIRAKVQTLVDVGLGYIHLGQNAVTFSGGEAQRIKLSKELNRRATGRTIYILDEPTTGLHFADVKKLLEILQSLTSQGNTVIVIEHNLDVIKQADYLIDLGPEGGDGGGEVVFQGTTEDILKCEKSHTGKFLAKIIKRHQSDKKSSGGASKKKKGSTLTLPEEQ